MDSAHPQPITSDDIQRYASGDLAISELITTIDAQTIEALACSTTTYLVRLKSVERVLATMSLDRTSQMRVSHWALFALFGEIVGFVTPTFCIAIEAPHEDLVKRVLKRLWNVGDADVGWLDEFGRQQLLAQVRAALPAPD